MRTYLCHPSNGVYLEQVASIFIAPIFWPCVYVHTRPLLESYDTKDQKKTFQYLEIHDPETSALFDEVLYNMNNVDILEQLIKITQQISLPVWAGYAVKPNFM